jgi:hypothetical protein
MTASSQCFTPANKQLALEYAVVDTAVFVNNYKAILNAV